MSAPPASIATSSHPKLHWSPVEASWIVSGSLIILAVLPHQVPAVGRAILQSWVGGLAFAGLSLWVAAQKRVLGTAMLILLVGVIVDGYLFHPKGSEGFWNQQASIQKDRVAESQINPFRWFEEQVLQIAPKSVQVRSDNPDLLFDKVTSANRGARWLDERELGENPRAVQARMEGGDEDP